VWFLRNGCLTPSILSKTYTRFVCFYEKFRLDEFLRFCHVVRNIYTFAFDPERIAHLVQRLHPCFERVQNELLEFADFLDQLAQEN
jgi:hypothetical protein